MVKHNKSNKASIISPQERFKADIVNDYSKNLFLNSTKKVSIQNFNTDVDLKNSFFFNTSNNSELTNMFVFNNKKFTVGSDDKPNLFNNQHNNVLENFNNSDSIFKLQPSFIKIKNSKIFDFFKTPFVQNSTKSSEEFNYIDGWDNTRLLKRSTGKNTPLRIVKFPIDHSNESNNLFFLRFDLEDSKLQQKNISDANYLSLKQKRYKRRKNMPLIKGVVNNEFGSKPFSGKLVLKNNSKLVVNDLDGDIEYKLMKKNKTRNDNVGVLFSKRLLRVKRTLVLPAHVNITAITNSYDVCHSWFIPGLGIKLDCVPGRATHHTFYIDNVGFYYGQCAEICGRYHHHMPIRVCALPFEHFLVW